MTTPKKPRPYTDGLEGLDPGCRALCEVLNDQQGIVTHGSCSGHNRHFFVSFTADTMEDLRTLMLKLVDLPEFRRHWHVETLAGGKQVWFVLTCPDGDRGDKLAQELVGASAAQG